MGLHDLEINNKLVAVIGYHISDTFANAARMIRRSYYNNTNSGDPLVIFDGANPYGGGHPTNSMYPLYLPKYNNAIGVPSSVDITITRDILTATTYTLHIKVIKKQTTVPSLTLQTALTQSDLDVNWQGQTKLYSVERAMYPNANGTAVVFDGAGEFNFDVNVDLGSWGGSISNGDWEFIAFAQDNNKSIDQGEKLNLKDTTTVGVENYVEESIDVRVYPNPASEKCFILTNFDSEKNVSIKVANFIGQEVYSASIGKTTYGKIYEINTSNYPKGLYFMNFIIDNQSISRIITVQ